MNIRRLSLGDEDIVRQLAVREPQTGLLDDDRTIMLAAFEDHEPIGFVLAYELPRRHGHAAMLSVYEIDVDVDRRRTGIATALMHHLGELARERGIADGFLLTNESNEAAMAFYASLGGERPNQDDVLWLLRF